MPRATTCLRPGRKSSSPAHDYTGAATPRSSSLSCKPRPLFEEAGNERALGRSWRALGYARGSLQGRCADWLNASERALPYYRRSGWSTSGCLSEIGSALYHGPTPIPDALERCERLLEEATDRPGRAHVLAFLAGLHSYDGRPEEALRLSMTRTTSIATSGTTTAWPIRAAGIRARVHLLAEEHESAQAVFRSCCETFERIGDFAALASVPPSSAAPSTPRDGSMRHGSGAL